MFSVAVLLVALDAPAAVSRLQKPDGPPPGSSSGELKDPVTGGFVIRYAVEAPKALPEENRMGLIVCFHGAGGSETSLTGRVLNALNTLKIADEYIVMGAKAQGGGWNANTDGPRVRKLIEWAKKTYPVDPRRVFCIGHSSGGLMNGSWGVRTQDIFAGVIISTGHYWPIPEAENAAETRTEIYLWHGTSDRVHPVQLSRDARDDYRAKGYRFIYREIQGHGHGFGPSSVLTDSLAWAHALRHKQIAPPPEDLEFLASLQNGDIAGRLLSKPRTFEELARIGGREAGRVILKAFENGNSRIRAMAALACGKTMFGKDVLKGLGNLLDDGNAKVRELAFEALAAAADWGHETAREILCSRALDENRSTPERACAAHYTGKTLKLALLGNYRDHGRMIWTLLALMNSRDPRLRMIAFEPLKDLKPNGVGYDPRLPANVREKVLAKWVKWARENCGEPPAGTASLLGLN